MNTISQLIKKKQELTSWIAFYTDSTNDLLARRYHRIARKVTIRETGETKVIPVIPFPEYSQRLLDDRKKATKLKKEAELIQSKIDILIKQQKENKKY